MPKGPPKSPPFDLRLFGHLDRAFWIYAIFLLLAYDLALSWLYRGPSAVPDEWWFLSVAKELQYNKGLAALAYDVGSQLNRLGYGAAYWLVYRACIVLFPDPLSSMRAFGVLSLVAVPASFLWGCNNPIPRQKALGVLLVLLWLTFPAAWWTGKVSGPEPMTMALIAFALSRLKRAPDERFVAWLLLGFACGIKLTCVPTIVFAMAMAASRWRFSPWLLVSTPLSLLGGFCLANPCVLLGHAREFYEMQYKYSHTQPAYEILDTVPRLFFDRQWTWDLLPSGNFFYWGVQWPAAVLLAGWISLGMLATWPLLAIFSTLAFAVAVMAVNAGFLGWYWFPTLIVLVAAMMWARTSKRLCHALLLVIVLVNLTLQMPNIAFAIQMKKLHDDVLLHRDSLQTSLQESLTDLHTIDFVLDLTDIDLNLNFRFVMGEEHIPFAMFKTKILTHYIHRIYKPPHLCGSGLLVMGPRFQLDPTSHEPRVWLRKFFPNISLVSEFETPDHLRCIFLEAACTPKDDLPDEAPNVQSKL